jgi:hypothetical protein
MSDAFDVNELRVGGCYHAAVVLNNFGVDLIDARRYNSAMKTFKDAIQAMKTVVRHDGTNQDSAVITCIQLSDIATLIDLAKERIAATHDDSPACGQTQNSGQEPGCPMNVSSHPPLDPLDTLCSPLRITSVDHIDPHCRNPDMASGIILYNFGVAHRYLSRQYQHHYPYDLSQGALRLFKMAYSVLSERNRLFNMHPGDLSKCRLLLLIIVLNSLIQVLEERGADNETLKWRQHLIELGQTIMDAESYASSPFFMDQMTLAPAA